MTRERTYRLLRNEGYLFKSCITQGLTALRRACDADPRQGDYYVAFFQLSIGLERLMKTTFIIHHMWKNDLATPSNQSLRQLGHRLCDLYSHMRSLDDVDSNPLDLIPNNSISLDILKVLDSFAKSSRYYNLDTLANETTITDPIEDYKLVMQRILKEDVSEKVIARTIRRQSMLASQMSPRVIAVDPGAPDESSDEIFARMMINPALQDLASRHAVYHVLVIITALKDLIEFAVDATHKLEISLGHTQISVPYMHEFLDFAWLNKSHILKKKRWP